MEIRGTTSCCIRRNGQVAIAGDGQVTMGQSTVMKAGAKKVRRLYHGQVLAGFAGSVADAFTLFEKFEGRLEEYRGNLEKAAVALAREWRTDKYLRQLEALLIHRCCHRSRTIYSCIQIIFHLIHTGYNNHRLRSKNSSGYTVSCAINIDHFTIHTDCVGTGQKYIGR